MVTRGHLLVGVAAMLTVVGAGCGGSKSPSVASLGPATTTTSSGGSSPSASALPKGGTADFGKFVDCMQKHGVQAQLGQGGKGVQITGGDPNSPQFRAAQKACQKLLPGGGPQPLSPAQAAQERTELLSLAHCMRKHGYPNFPDPDSQGAFDFNSSNSSVDPNSRQFQSAMSACRPGNGKVPLRIGIRVGSPGP